LIVANDEKKTMKIQFAKIALMAAFGFALSFAQVAPERLAIYVSGANETAVNKSINTKLLAAMTQTGEYTEIGDPSSFQDEIAKGGKEDLTSVVQVAKRYGADYVCTVNITEVFGTHSVIARLIKISSSQIVKTGSSDRSLKSLDDLTRVSYELARQFLSLPPPAPAIAEVHPAIAQPPPVIAAPVPAIAENVVDNVVAPIVVAPVVVQKRCARMYNINELLFKIKDSFPSKLKDCSSTLAKDMLTPASFGGKKLEPKSFMMQCPIDGIKKELPEGFPNADKILGSITNFVQGLMNSALAGGGLDPKKLVSAVASMNINGLLNDVKSLASDECIVNAPYEPPAKYNENYSENYDDEGEDNKSNKGKKRRIVSFGIRTGFNYSHTYMEYYDGYGGYGGDKKGDYGDIGGMQAGFVLDIAASKVFHIQHGIMYIQKGMYDEKAEKYSGRGELTTHYLEFPSLISLKFSALRLSAGPYFGVCIDNSGDSYEMNFSGKPEFGLSVGIGFDIGMFYIGAFYDYDFLGSGGHTNNLDYNLYNRTIGFNLGINL